MFFYGNENHGIFKKYVEKKIERKINPLWTKQEKMMFVYQQLCEYLTYDENIFNGSSPALRFT